MDLSHKEIHLKPDSKSRESDEGGIRPEGPILLSPKQNAYSNTKKLLPGKVYAEIPLDACKCYPTRIFADVGVKPVIAVADRNTKKENPILAIKLEPGCKTACYPQIAFYVKGNYHLENVLYPKSNPHEWVTWIEFYLDGRQLKEVIEALIRIQLALEGIQT